MTLNAPKSDPLPLQSLGKAASNRLFDDALDELDITFDTYFELDRYRPKCLHVLTWLYSNGFSHGDVLIIGPFPKPLAVCLKKLGGNIREIRTTPGKKDGRNQENLIRPSFLGEVLDPVEKYDLILCDDLLQYLANPTRTLQLLIDHLREKGILLLITPNIARGSSRLMLLTGRNILPPLEDASGSGSVMAVPTKNGAAYREYTLGEVKGLVSGGKLVFLKGQYIIGKRILDYFHYIIPIPMTTYFTGKLYQGIQALIPPFRSHLFVAAAKPCIPTEKVQR